MDGRYIVYGSPGSGSVPVEAALTLIGAPYEVIGETVLRNLARDPAVLEVNPLVGGHASLFMKAGMDKKRTSSHLTKSRPRPSLRKRCKWPGIRLRHFIGQSLKLVGRLSVQSGGKLPALATGPCELLTLNRHELRCDAQRPSPSNDVLDCDLV